MGNAGSVAAKRLPIRPAFGLRLVLLGWLEHSAPSFPAQKRPYGLAGAAVKTKGHRNA